MSNNYLEINLSSLEKSSSNVRKTVDKLAMEELKASIAAHGLLENLVVVRGDGVQKGKYLVVAGGRRLDALKALVKEKKLETSHTVSCLIVDEEGAQELSLAENVVREAMHPADEFEAFAKLADNKMTPAQIAQRFGITEKKVIQRLKLGSVAKEILEYFREGKMNLESVMAFTLESKPERQLSVFKNLKKSGNLYQHGIRRALTEKMARVNDAEVKFVGLAAYKKAGGIIREDLFEDDSYLESNDILQKLVGEKIEQAKAKLLKEGWGRVEVLEDSGDYYEKYNDMPKTPKTKEEKANATCVIWLGYAGTLEERKGVRLHKDAKAAAVKEKKKKAGGMSQALTTDMASFRMEVARVAIAEKPAIAMDMVLFKIISNGIADMGHGRIYGDLSISLEHEHPSAFVLSQKTPAATKFLQLSKELPSQFMKAKTESERFAAFCDLALCEKLVLLAFCTALALEAKMGGKAGFYEDALGLTGVDVRELWTPTKENYFSRITTGEMLAIVKEIFGADVAKKNASSNKKQLTELLDKAFKKPETASTDKAVLEKLKTWLPAGMAFTTAPPKAKSKKAA